MTTAATLPVIIPLIAAAVALVATRHLAIQRIVGITASTLLAAVSIWLLIAVDTEGTIVVAVGGWAPPLGIALVADRLAVLLLATASLALLAVLVYAVAQRATDEELGGFHAVYQLSLIHI